MKYIILTLFTLGILLISCGQEKRSAPIVSASIATPQKVTADRLSLPKDYWYAVGQSEHLQYLTIRIDVQLLQDLALYKSFTVK